MRAVLIAAAVAAVGCGPTPLAVDAGPNADARGDAAAGDAATIDGADPDARVLDGAAPDAGGDAGGADAGGCTTVAFTMDGALDASATVIAGGVTGVRLAVAAA